VSQLLREEGFELDPDDTGLYPRVIHFETSNSGLGLQGLGDVFIFSSGTVVAWNTSERLVKDLTDRVLLPAAIQPHGLEYEDLEYLEEPSIEVSEIIGDTVLLGTGIDLSSPRSLSHDQIANVPSTNSKRDITLVKIAFSSGLARAAKLAVLESSFETYFETTRSIPTDLSRGSHWSIKRSHILRKTGELLNIRAQLNLYSELTDSLPDLLWETKHELGLEGYYDAVGRALDTGIRIKRLNERMDYAQEIAGAMREILNEKHSTRLEWAIIVLICIEVLIEFNRLWQEHKDWYDAER